MTVTEAQGSHFTFGLSEGLILAASPAFAYIMALRFEAGYLNWYGLPADLVELSLDHLVFSWTILLGLLLAVIALVGTLPLRPWHRILSRIFHMLFYGAVVGLVLLARSESEGSWRIALTVLLAVVGLFVAFALFIEIVVPLLKYRDTPSWLDRFERFDSALASSRRETVLDFAVQTIGLRVLWIWIIGCLFFLGMPVSNFLGAAVARSKIRYLTLNAPDCAVVRLYGNRLVCLEFDRRHNRFGRLIRLVPTDGMRNIPLKIECSTSYLHRHQNSTNTFPTTAGVPVHVVAKRVRPANPEMTLDVYGHALMGQDGDAVAKLAAYYSAAAV